MAKTYKSFESLREDLGLPKKQESTVQKSRAKKKKTAKKNSKSILSEKANKESKGEREAATLKLKQLETIILCPKHRSVLDTGSLVRIEMSDAKSEIVALYYCHDCGQYYFTTDKIPYGKTINYHNKKAENIAARVYKYENGKLNVVESPSQNKATTKEAVRRRSRSINAENKAIQRNNNSSDKRVIKGKEKKNYSKKRFREQDNYTKTAVGKTAYGTENEELMNSTFEKTDKVVRKK